MNFIYKHINIISKICLISIVLGIITSRFFGNIGNTILFITLGICGIISLMGIFIILYMENQ